jgi:hypothetical protein
MFANLDHRRGIYRTKFALLIVTTRGPEKEVAFIRETDNSQLVLAQLRKREGAARIFTLSEVLDSQAGKEVRAKFEKAVVGDVVLLSSRAVEQRFRGETADKLALAELKRMQKGLPEEISVSPLPKPKINPPGSIGQETWIAMIRRDQTKDKK